MFKRRKNELRKLTHKKLFSGNITGFKYSKQKPSVKLIN